MKGGVLFDGCDDGDSVMEALHDGGNDSDRVLLALFGGHDGGGGGEWCVDGEGVALCRR